MAKKFSLDFVLSFVGKKIGRLTIMENVNSSIGGHKMISAICDCGIVREYRLSSIISGHTVSCGCLNKENKIKHGHVYHPLYKTYECMKERCYKSKNDNYGNYGARGVIVCDEWKNNFLSFYNWAIVNGWKKGLQLDKDIIPKKLGISNLLYSPENCCFVTPKVNSRNKSNNTILTFRGKSLCISEWADILNINKNAIGLRIKHGWSIERTLTTPVKKIA